MTSLGGEMKGLLSRPLLTATCPRPVSVASGSDPLKVYAKFGV